jgi:DNA-directed RNA polymerase subunit beta'
MPNNLKKVFQLNVKENELLKHGQTIAQLNENYYRIETGGTVYYTTIHPGNKKNRNIKKIFTGFLYWVPEEIHQLNSLSIEKIKVNDGNFIKKGTILLPNIFSKIDGFARINNQSSELTITPGELYQVKSHQINSIEKINRFIKPGEFLFSNLIVQKLSYIEFVTFKGLEYILLRPVLVYKVPQEKGFTVQYRFFPDVINRSAAFRTVKRVFYKDEERVKVSNGVDLLKTFLVLDIRNKYAGLNSKIEYLPLLNANSQNQKYQLKLTLYERIKVNKINLNDNYLKERISLKTITQNNQYINAQTVVAKIEIFTNVNGTITAIKNSNNIELLILKENFIKKCIFNKNLEILYVSEGDLVRVGTYLTSKTRSKYAGQIHKIKENLILIRLGRPYLLSEGTILRAGNRSLVEKSDLLATLVYDKLKTVDIVQGLPKVEEILEARKIKNGCLLAPNQGQVYLKAKKIELIVSPDEKLSISIGPQIKVNFNNGKYVSFLEPLTDGPISPHDKLETLFNYYQSEHSIQEACKKV